MDSQKEIDHKYREGTIVQLKAMPSERVLIMRYHQRIYFCTPANAPLERQMPYFERELQGSDSL